MTTDNMFLWAEAILMSNHIVFMEKCGKISINYRHIPALSVALILILICPRF